MLALVGACWLGRLAHEAAGASDLWRLVAVLGRIN